MALPNWLSRYLEIGEQKYGSNTSAMFNGIKGSAKNEAMRKIYQSVQQTNKDFSKKWIIGGKDFNHLTVKNVLVDKPALMVLEGILSSFSPAEGAKTKPYDHYVQPDHLNNALVPPKDMQFKIGETFVNAVQSTVEQWQWSNWFTYKQWREELLPHVLKTCFSETLDRMQDNMAQKLRKDNVSPEEQRKMLKQLALDMGADFEKYTEYLANHTEYLVKPLKAFATPETQAAEKIELDKLTSGLSNADDIKKVKDLYARTKSVISASELDKRIKARMAGEPIVAPAESRVKDEQKPETAEKEEKKPAEVEEPKLMALPEGTPKWIAKAAGYDTRGTVQYLYESAKNAVVNGAVDYTLDAGKKYVSNMVTDWRKSKVLCGKDYSPLNIKTKLTTWGIQQGTDRLKSAIDNLSNYVVGNDVCEYALMGQAEVDPQLAVDLYNISGVKISEDSIDKKISRMITESPWKDYFSQDQWKTEIMPHLIRTAYKEQFSEIQNSILQKYSDENTLSNRDILAQAMSKAANTLGRIYEKYSLDIANNTDYLAAPMTMGTDSKLIEDTLEKFKGLPEKNYDALKKTLTQNSQLFDAEKISNEIKKKVDKAKSPQPEACIKSILKQKANDTKSNNSYGGDKALKERMDNVNYMKGVLAIREMKKNLEKTGFFRKYIFNGEYKRQRAAIAQYEADLTQEFKMSEETTKNLTDLNTPLEKGIAPGDLLGIEREVYQPDSPTEKVLKDGIKMAGQIAIHMISSTAKIGSMGVNAIKTVSKILSENTDQIIDVISEKSKPLMDGIKKVGEVGTNVVNAVKDGIVTGVTTVVNTGMDLTVKGVQGVKTVVQTGANLVSGAYNGIYNAGSSVFNGIRSFFGGSNAPEQPEPGENQPEENKEVNESREKDEFVEISEEFSEEILKEVAENIKVQKEKTEPENKSSEEKKEIVAEESKPEKENSTSLENENEEDLFEDCNETPKDEPKHETADEFVEIPEEFSEEILKEVAENIKAQKEKAKPENKTNEEKKEIIAEESEPEKENNTSLEDENEEDLFEDCNETLKDEPEKKLQKTDENPLSLNSETQIELNKSYNAFYEKMGEKIKGYQSTIQNLESFSQKDVMQCLFGIAYCKEISNVFRARQYLNAKEQVPDNELESQLQNLEALNDSLDSGAFEKTIIAKANKDESLKLTIITAKESSLQTVKEIVSSENSMEQFYQYYVAKKKESAPKEKQELKDGQPIVKDPSEKIVRSVKKGSIPNFV